MGFPESDVSLMSICKGMSPAVVKRNQLLTEQKIYYYLQRNLTKVHIIVSHWTQPYMHSNYAI